MTEPGLIEPSPNPRGLRLAFVSFAAMVGVLASPAAQTQPPAQQRGQQHTPQQAVAQLPVPQLTGRVMDLAQALTPTERQALERQLAQLESNSGAQVAVLVVRSTAPEAIEVFSLRVARTWRLGRPGVGDGVLITLAVADRAVRMEVSNSLADTVPGESARQIVSGTMIPALRAGRHAEGLAAGIAELVLLLRCGSQVRC